MSRVILGFLKGLVVGGGVGFAMLRLGINAPFLVYAGCAIVGALVGVVCGRPPWRSETIWTPVVKAIFGGAVGIGLCALGMRALPDVLLASVGGMDVHSNGAGILSTAIGVLYGIFVEVDDGGAADKSQKSKALPAKKPAKS